MIHGRKASACEEVVRAISRTVGTGDYRVVYSTAEFKKVRVRYFEEG
jgi:hypothetical protein